MSPYTLSLLFHLFSLKNFNLLNNFTLVKEHFNLDPSESTLPIEDVFTTPTTTITNDFK